MTEAEERAVEERRKKVGLLNVLEHRIRTVHATGSSRHITLRVPHYEVEVLLEAIKLARANHNGWIAAIEHE